MQIFKKDDNISLKLTNGNFTQFYLFNLPQIHTDASSIGLDYEYIKNAIENNRDFEVAVYSSGSDIVIETNFSSNKFSIFVNTAGMVHTTLCLDIEKNKQKIMELIGLLTRYPKKNYCDTIRNQV